MADNDADDAQNDVQNDDDDVVDITKPRAGWVEHTTTNLDRRVPTWRRQLTITRKPDNYKPSDDPRALETRAYAMLDDTRVLVPRQWAAPAPASASPFSNPAGFAPLALVRPNGAPHLGNFTTVLCETTPPQSAAAAAIVEALQDPRKRAGVLCLPCGFGKTVLALWLFLHMARRHGAGFRAVILVHKEPLADQWAERAAQFVPGVRIGRVQEKRCDFQDKDLVIVMIQSLVASKRVYPAALFDECSMLIVDECHRVGSAAFSRAAPMFGARYRVGLSATPERRDGLTPILFWHLGDIVFRTERVFEHVMVERLMNTAAAASAPDSPARSKWYREINYTIAGKKVIGLAKMITNLTLEPLRNHAIVQRIMWACRQGRKVLALTDRREHAEHIQDYLTQYWARDAAAAVAAEAVDYVPRTASLYLGAMKKAVREQAVEAQVIVATYGMAFEALDIPRLDTLIMMTPRSEIEQPCGRIFRPHPSKHTPLIIDVVDPFSLFQVFAHKHTQWYRSLDYRTASIDVCDAASPAVCNLDESTTFAARYRAQPRSPSSPSSPKRVKLGDSPSASTASRDIRSYCSAPTAATTTSNGVPVFSDDDISAMLSLCD